MWPKPDDINEENIWERKKLLLPKQKHIQVVGDRFNFDELKERAKQYTICRAIAPKDDIDKM